LDDFSNHLNGLSGLGANLKGRREQENAWDINNINLRNFQLSGLAGVTA